jgi:hypothetical protein
VDEVFSGFFNGLPESEFGMVVQIGLLCGLIFLAGRAFVAFFFPTSNHSNPKTEQATGYLSVASSSVVILALTWYLKLRHGYTFDHLITALLVIAIAAFAIEEYRVDFGRWRRINSVVFFIYLTTVLTFWIMLSSEEYDNNLLKNTSMYLSQGFGLFLDQDPGTMPLYGTMIVAPLLYAEHTVAATFALFSYEKHFLYYVYGEYWMNMIVGPIIPIGAYLFFTRLLPSRLLSMAVAVLFCYVILDFKVWNLRAESLAWIPAFAFLILLVDFLSSSRGLVFSALIVRYVTGMALMFFTLAMTHGVTMLIVLFISIGITLRFLLAEASLKSAGRLAVSFLLFGAFVSVIFSGFAATYSTASIVENDLAPPAGMPDAAMEYDNATRELPLDTDMRLTLAHPPYISRLNAVKMAALLPPASLFHQGIYQYRIRDFPSVPLRELSELTSSEYYFYPALFVGCCIFFLLIPTAVSMRVQALFWASVATYVFIALLTLYLDSKSVGLFPIVSVRRTYPYAAFFYWLSVAITMPACILHIWREVPFRASFSHLAKAMLAANYSRRVQSWLYRKPLKNLHAVDKSVLWIVVLGELALLPIEQLRRFTYHVWQWPTVNRVLQNANSKVMAFSVGLSRRVLAAMQSIRDTYLFGPAKTVAELKDAERRFLIFLLPIWALVLSWRTTLIIVLVPLWLAHSINHDRGRPDSVLGLVGRAAERLSGLVRPADAAPGVNILDPMFQAVAYVSNRIPRGAQIYSNLMSEGTFWYLSNGRVSLLDGTSIYQLFWLQRDAARRLVKFADFARTANMDDLEGFNVKYVLLFKGKDCNVLCYSDPVFTTDISHFVGNPRFTQAFENSAYVILKVNDIPSEPQFTPTSSLPETAPAGSQPAITTAISQPEITPTRSVPGAQAQKPAIAGHRESKHRDRRASGRR